MSNHRQLCMRCSDLSDLPPLELGEMEIHCHVPGEEAVWEDIIERSFEHHFSFEKFLIPAGGYDPSYILYLRRDGVDIATAMGTEHKDFPGEGWFRMVGTVPEARGTGAGKKICLAVMHDLKKRGYNSIVLSTDDYRLPAIAMYRSLGFNPIIFDEEHKARWEAVECELKKLKK